jgi:hypothetical protein
LRVDHDHPTPAFSNRGRSIHYESLMTQSGDRRS